MIITVEAIYENGVLKPVQPLPLPEHQHVEIIVRLKSAPTSRTAGVVPCQDAALIEWAAMSPDLEYPSKEEV